MRLTKAFIPSGCSYDPVHQVWTIHGIKYTDELFQMWAAIPIDSLLRVKSRADGVLALERVSPETLRPRLIPRAIEDVGDML